MGDESGHVRFPVEGDQLIVATPECGEVRKLLDDLGVGSPRVEDSSLLGLSRITLPDVRRLASDIGAKVRATAGAPALLAAPRDTDGPIDDVLRGLRALFKVRHAGWSPRLAKNRLVGHLQGVGEISHGGTGDPVPATTAAWAGTARATGPGAGVRVGVLDTAVDPHPWLGGGWAARLTDVVPAGQVPPYAGGHATFVAGLVLSQAPGAVLEVRQVLLGERTDSWAVANEIVLAGRRGLDVLNLSFVCYTEDGEPPFVLATAIDRLPTDLVVVAAAGNHGSHGEGSGCTQPACAAPAWPAALDDVVAVGAAVNAETFAPFSPVAPWVDLHTRGVDLTSTYLPRVHGDGGTTVEFPDRFATWSGTSFAAALVSGAIAAGTEPGRVSAQESLQDIRASLSDPPPSEPPRPRGYLNLRTS
jgi:membrane-anchored mycosin MYCP